MHRRRTAFDSVFEHLQWESYHFKSGEQLIKFQALFCGEQDKPAQHPFVLKTMYVQEWTLGNLHQNAPLLRSILTKFGEHLVHFGYGNAVGFNLFLQNYLNTCLALLPNLECLDICGSCMRIPFQKKQLRRHTWFFEKLPHLKFLHLDRLYDDTFVIQKQLVTLNLPVFI